MLENIAMVIGLVLALLAVVFNRPIAEESVRGSRIFSRDRSDVGRIAPWKIRYNRVIFVVVGLFIAGMCAYNLFIA